MMNHPIRHSHIAVRGELLSLAKTAGAIASSGEDELGPYRFFDLRVSGMEGSDQRIRFAAHEGDGMVHLLAERIENVNDLASALVHAGVRDTSALSISTNQKGVPLRDVKEIAECMSARLEANDTEVLKPVRKRIGNMKLLRKDLTFQVDYSDGPIQVTVSKGMISYKPGDFMLSAPTGRAGHKKKKS